MLKVFLGDFRCCFTKHTLKASSTIDKLHHWRHVSWKQTPFSFYFEQSCFNKNIKGMNQEVPLHLMQRTGPDGPKSLMGGSLSPS